MWPASNIPMVGCHCPYEVWSCVGNLAPKLGPTWPCTNPLCKIGPGSAQAAPNLGLSWQLEPKLAPLGHVGPEVRLRSKSGPTCRNWEHFGDSFAPSWAQRKDKGTLPNTKHHRCQIPVKLRVLTISYCAGHVPHFGAKLGRSWSQVGPSWAEVG